MIINNRIECTQEGKDENIFSMNCVCRWEFSSFYKCNRKWLESTTAMFAYKNINWSAIII